MGRVKVRFTDALPPAAHRSYPWGDIAEQLRARPGEWALVLEDIPASVPPAVNAGRIATVHPDKGFRTQMRKTSRPANGPRMCGEMYMRYDPSLDLGRRVNGEKK